MRALLFAGILFLTISSCAAKVVERVTLPGTCVSMAPPSGWIAADTFTGFQDKGTGSSIVVTDMDGAPYSKTSGGFTKEQAASRDMTLISKAPAVFGSHKGVILTLRQESRGETYGRWIACFGDESRTAMVVASVNQAVVEQMKDPVLASLRTACFEARTAVDLFAGLLFQMQAKEPYRAAKRISSTVIFTHGGEFPTSSPTAPIFIAGNSLGSPQVADRQAFAKERIKKTASVTNVSIYDSGACSVDGLSGVSLVATATDTATRTPMVVYQVLLFDKDVYYIMQGIASQKAGAEASIWLEMAKSFKRKANVPKNP